MNKSQKYSFELCQGVVIHKTIIIKNIHARFLIILWLQYKKKNIGKKYEFQNTHVLHKCEFYFFRFYACDYKEQLNFESTTSTKYLKCANSRILSYLFIKNKSLRHSLTHIFGMWPRLGHCTKVWKTLNTVIYSCPYYLKGGTVGT